MAALEPKRGAYPHKLVLQKVTADVSHLEEWAKGALDASRFVSVRDLCSHKSLTLFDLTVGKSNCEVKHICLPYGLVMTNPVNGRLWIFTLDYSYCWSGLFLMSCHPVMIECSLVPLEKGHLVLLNTGGH